MVGTTGVVFRFICAAIVVVAAAWTESVSAAPFVEQVDPPVLRRGHATRVTLRGTGLHQVVGVWLSLPTSAATASVVSASRTGEATLDVSVPADAPLGMHGLRLATRGGLSNVHIVLVDELPLTQTPVQTVELPACIAAACQPAIVDRYPIQVASGQTVSFEVVGSRFGKNYDPLVTIRDESGRIVARRDNDPGLFYDCRFAHTFQASGRYVVEVQDARYEGDPTWNYVLRMGNFPAANVAVPSAVLPGTSSEVRLPELSRSLAFSVPGRTRMSAFYQELRFAADAPASWVPLHASTATSHVVEVEPNDTPDNAATVADAPGTLNGVLESPGDVDCFALHLTRGQSFDITGVSREIGSAADLELVLIEPDGREARRIDDVSLRLGRQTIQQEAKFPWSVRKDGWHSLMVRDLAGDGRSSFAYRVDVTETKPTLTLAADVSRLTVPQQSWQPLPIKVTRQRLAGAVELELIGAPPGVSLEPTTIPADVSDIVCRIVASADAELGISTLEVVGRWTSEDGNDKAEAVVMVKPMIDRQLINKDRIPYALRDNQLRLPPSLVSRLALMVTPPAPFEVVLPEELIVLTKYQTAVLPVRTTRRDASFVAPIAFAVTGGQIGVEEQERDNLFAKIPVATPDQPDVSGVLFNRINTRYEKARADVSATAQVDGHEVTLFRAFDLDVRSAFKPTLEPAVVTVAPGETAKIKLVANRTPTHDGEVIVRPTVTSGLSFPEQLVIARGQEFVEFEIAIPVDQAPRRLSIRFESRGYVDRYEEHLREPNLTIDVKKPK